MKSSVIQMPGSYIYLSLYILYMHVYTAQSSLKRKKFKKEHFFCNQTQLNVWDFDSVRLVAEGVINELLW